MRLDSYRVKCISDGEKTIPVGYSFTFGNSFDGIPVSALQGNNILRVYMDSDDVYETTIKWDRFEKAEEHDIMLSKSEDALALVLDDKREHTDYYAVIDPIKIVDVQLSYSTSVTEDDSYRLVWEFFIEDLPSIHGDVCTKKIFNLINPS